MISARQPEARASETDAKEALAKARAVVAHARTALAEVTSQPHPEVRHSSSLSARRKSMRRVADHYRPACLGAVSATDCTRAAFGMVYPIEPNAARVEGLGVFQETMDFGKRRAGRTNGLPLGSAGVIREPAAHVDIHVIKRLIQRRGLREPDAVLKALRPLLGWCLAAEKTAIHGNFFIPAEDGLFACERAAYLGTPSGERVVRVKTFIHRDSMTAFNRAAHKVLADAMSRVAPPRMPTLISLSAAQMEGLRVMRRVGEEWEARRIERVDLRARSEDAGPQPFSFF